MVPSLLGSSRSYVAILSDDFCCHFPCALSFRVSDTRISLSSPGLLSVGGFKMSSHLSFFPAVSPVLTVVFVSYPVSLGLL